VAAEKHVAKVLALLLLILAPKVHALIDPKFTPIHLVEQSALILELDLKQDTGKEQYVGTVRAVLKGKTALKALTLDLSRAANEQHADAFRGLVKASGGGPALFFVGQFLADDADGQEFNDDPPRKVGYLHVGSKWSDFEAGENGRWTLTVLAGAKEKLWAGSSDMLLRTVHYIIRDDDPQVPVNAGVTWSGKPSRIARRAGKIRAVRPVHLTGNGPLALFVAADNGDRLLICDRKTRKFKDVTAEKKLHSASRHFAWGDFNGDGTLDLISLSGGALSLYAQQANGTFRSAAVPLPHGTVNGCVGLASLDGGRHGFSALLVSRPSALTLVLFGAKGTPTLAPLISKGVDVGKYGKAGASIVADFDGDALPDVIQPFAKGSLFFKGLEPGRFAPGVACPMRLGPGRSNWCLADFDGDGRLDIFTVAEDACRIWQNEGGGTFANLLGVSGEIAYISKPDGVDCMVGDVNNDGRQDVLICYDTESPQIFFNRGFRSFGHAHMLDLSEKQLLEAAESGQRAGCLGDFDGDGAQDMVLALSNGELYVLFRDNQDGAACNLTALLPVKGGHKGPVTVVGWLKGDREREKQDRCLGAWNVLPGTSLGFVGLTEPGPVTIRWTLPGGKRHEKDATVEGGAVRVEIK